MQYHGLLSKIKSVILSRLDSAMSGTHDEQVIFPLAQGTLWELALCGWRFWGRSTQISGNSVGSRIRRAGIRARLWLIDNGMVRRE